MKHTTIIEWSNDLSDAPKGETVERSVVYERKGQKEMRRWEDFVPTKILALSNCGKVVPTYWVPEQRSQNGSIMRHGHWSGFVEDPAFGSGPVAWAYWPDAVEVMKAYKGKEA